MRVDEVRERRPDVLVDEERRVLLGVLEQLLRVHHDRGDLLDVDRDLRVLGAGRGLVGGLVHERGGRAADVLGELDGAGPDASRLGERGDGGLPVDAALECALNELVGGEVAAGRVRSREQRDCVGHEALRVEGRANYSAFTPGGGEARRRTGRVGYSPTVVQQVVVALASRSA
jgi:hypothetical protein